MTGRPLPPTLQEIARHVSLDAALKLATAKGGQRISIPPKITSGHWLVEVLGLEDAKALSKHFTYEVSCHLEVPFGPTSNSAMRQAQIAKLVSAGKSANEIAAAAHITRRHAFRKRNAIRNAPKLPDLFEVKRSEQRTK